MRRARGISIGHSTKKIRINSTVAILIFWIIKRVFSLMLVKWVSCKIMTKRYCITTGKVWSIPQHLLKKCTKQIINSNINQLVWRLGDCSSYFFLVSSKAMNFVKAKWDFDPSKEGELKCKKGQIVSSSF